MTSPAMPPESEKLANRVKVLEAEVARWRRIASLFAFSSAAFAAFGVVQLIS